MADTLDMTLELVMIPVSDVDRAKEFYTRVGFNPDHDSVVDANTRFVQMTPPGSNASIAFGRGIVDGEPGSIKGLLVCVSDIEAARAHLLDQGIEVSEVDVQPWGHFVYFADPDGNAWSVQYLPYRYA
ncbi:glyoxalase [Williamsia phyllosphaerae]|uniref:Glyoxalase n=1 Tax=Williamsia phyllosphaerae TaxID=885042 RepID=A0ABQ1UQ31_9NOCA|nr:glyoxalase [Williamsia phyllosphaerae]